MSRRCRVGRRHRLRGAGAALLIAALAIAPLAAAPAATAAGSPTPTAVSISVVSATPSIPAPSTGLRTLRFTLSIANHTNAPLRNVTITAMRAFPLTSPAELSAATEHPAAPMDGQVVTPIRPVTVNLPPGAESTAVTRTFVTTTGVPTNAGLCLCANEQVYPIWFSAYGVTDGVAQLLGQTETFVPSFYRRPAPLHVSWVWPIIDRPHRLVGSNIFTDDGLAASVSTGRLWRCLQVLKNVAGKVPITVVIDPELLDELEVMATGKYTYRSAAGKLVPGTGQQAATAWLQELQTVVKDDPQVSVVLTPNGDPAVGALARAHLSWSATLPSAERQRVEAALGGATPSTSFAWPPSGTVGPAALRELSGTGVTSLLLDSQAVQPQDTATGAPITLARLRSGSHRVVAALTSPSLASYTAAAVGGDGIGGGGLPQLMSALTVFAAQATQPDQQVILAPPRYVDPAVNSASQAIRRTSSSLLTQPANVLDVVAAAGTTPFNEPPVATPARLQPQRHPPTGLPPASIRVARSVTDSVASLQEMFDGSAAAHAFVDQLYNAVQLIESAAWRHGSGLGGRRLGVKFAHQLRAEMSHLESRVHIVRPAAGSYTLASANSPLPITVENDLPYPVHVQVVVRTVNSLPGLDARPMSPQDIDPASKATLHVPTQVQRSGTFKVFAVLQTPDGHRIGRPIRLSVHSTVLGTIGVIITIVSGAVLVLALVIRFLRRWRARRREPQPRRPWSARSPAPAGSTGAVAGDAPVGALTDFLASPGAGAPPPSAN